VLELGLPVRHARRQVGRPQVLAEDLWELWEGWEGYVP
jgi:hypothetical protein